MYYTIYKITNLVNNKIYIGMHQTNDLDDGYMGSGLYLNNAKQKYGLENFTKEYLHFLDSYEEMCDKEKELVDKDFLLREDVYNLTLGGEGSFHYINTNGLANSKEHIRLATIKRIELIKNDKDFYVWWHTSLKNASLKMQSEKRGIFGIALSDQQKSAIHAGKFANTDSAKLKRKASHTDIKFQQGTNNSQFGTQWISNPNTNESKKAKFGNVPDGWILGRNKKFALCIKCSEQFIFNNNKKCDKCISSLRYNDKIELLDENIQISLNMV